MLIEFKVKNFKSFKDEQVFSMVASPDRNLSQNTITIPPLGNNKLVKSAVIYGHNASGKSNLVRAFDFVKMFILTSDNRTPGSEIRVQPFKLSNSTINAPSEFEVTFLQDGIRYQYGFVVDSKKVYKEWLIAYPKKLPQVWFERNPKAHSEESDWKFGSHYSGEREKLIRLTRPDVLFLTVAAKFNNKLLTVVYRWFLEHLQLADAYGNAPNNSLFSMQQFLNNEKTRNGITKLLQLADLGIIDLEIEEKPFPENLLPTNVPDEFLSLILKSNYLDVQIRHKGEELNSFASLFTLADESRGTEKLLSISGPLLDALDKGNVLMIDELDSSLHSALVRELVKLFYDQNGNSFVAQLIFNTHDTTFLDFNLFRRDQIWFVEKDNSGASHLYPLSDFSPRKDEALQRGYLQGRYGAIPIIDGLAEVATTSG